MRRSIKFFLAGTAIGILVTPLTWPILLTAFEELLAGTALFYAIILIIPAHMVFFGLIGAASSFLFSSHKEETERLRPAAAALAKLGRNYFVHEQFRITESSSIDHLVVGPTGAWVIHLMPDHGKITYIHNELAGNGELLKGNHFEKILAQTEIIKDTLATRVGMEFAAHPVLVFTSPDALVRCGDKPLRGVHVVSVRDVRSLITRKPTKVFSASTVLAMERSIKMRIT